MGALKDVLALPWAGFYKGSRTPLTSLQHQARPIRALLAASTSLQTCRYVAGMQLEHLRRAGVLAYRRPLANHGHHRVEPRDK